MDRRGFLKFAAGGTAGLLASPIIWNTLYDAVYWTQNWGWIPRLKKGKSEYLPVVSKLCPSGTGILVRTVSGTPVRTIGDKNNPVTHGSMTALAASEAELRVAPSRIKKPLLRSADGAYSAISWDDAEKLLKEKAAAAGNSLAVISGDPTSSVNEVLSAILSAKDSGDFFFMPDDEQAALAAWKAMGGKNRLGYDIENSDCILAAAPVLESWGVVAGNRAAFNKHHPAGGEATQKLIYAGPVQNNTAAGADLWLPVRPGTETVLLLGIARQLLKAGRNAVNFETGTAPSGLQEFANFVEQYTPEKVCAATGVPAARYEAAVRMLLDARKPLAVAGSALGCGGAAAPVMAAIAIDMILGRVAVSGGLVPLPDHASVVPGAMRHASLMANSLVDYTQGVASGKTQAPAFLLIHAANPVYALPAGSGALETVRKAGFTVAVAPFFSETCAEADLVLPAALGMEGFDDVQTPYGSSKITYAFARPIARPYGEARPAGEVYIALAKALGVSTEVRDMPELLYKHAFELGTPFRAMLEQGTVHTASSEEPCPKLRFNVRILQAAAAAQPSSGKLALAPVAVLGMGTAVTSVPPFATKTVTDYQICGKYSIAQMNGATASGLGVKDGDMIRLSAGASSAAAIVSIFEGVTPATVSLVAGLGHTAFDDFTRGKGCNVVSLTAITREPGTGLPVWGTSGLEAARA